MKISIVFFLLLISFSAHAQKLWERNDKQHCVQTQLDLDGIEKKLNLKFPDQKCIYLKDSVRVVLGSFFKCVDGKVYSYFRTQDSCEMFFKDTKKELTKFAPTSIKNKKRWVAEFGSCMESASERRMSIIGIQSMNNICYCMAAKIDESSESDKRKLALECAKNIGVRE